jgi:hypothetical protein
MMTVGAASAFLGIAMARCYQCGTQTDGTHHGSSLCIVCHDKLSPAPKTATLGELNSRLSTARDEYRHAVRVRREALELKRCLDQSNPDGSMALQNAKYEVERASMDYRQALRDFVTELAREADKFGFPGDKPDA